MSDDAGALGIGMEHVRAGIETLRSVFGLMKDAKDALPAGDDKMAIGAAIDTSARQLQFAEAELAKALGYRLCHCQFPPTPMLTVGHSNARSQPPGPVHECPKCHADTSAPFTFTRTRTI